MTPLTVVDCADTILKALERQKQMETSGRGKVEQLKEAVEELNRNIWNTIECLSPVPFIGMVAGGKGPEGTDIPPREGGPYRKPGTREPSPATKEFIRKLKELEERLKRRRWWRRR